MRQFLFSTCAVVCLAVAALARAQSAPDTGSGTLIVAIAPFTSEIELKKKVQAQLESGILEWGQTGNRLVFTLVNKRFIGVDLGNSTRYGQSKELSLPAGDYLISCAGLEPVTAFNPLTMLSKGGYFNIDVMSVHIEASKTTTLNIRPVIQKKRTLLLNVFLPDLLATATLDGVTSPEVSLNDKTDKSVRWDDYHGDLKFVSADKK